MPSRVLNPCLWLGAALIISTGTSCGERSTAASPESASDLPKCCPKPDTPDAGGSITMTHWLRAGERVKQLPADLRATNQEGDELRLSSLIGRPLVITFVYTRCSNANKCVRVMQKTAKLQAALEESGLGAKAILLVFTYDPEFDSPAVLKTYGETHGFRFGPNAMMLRINPAEKAELMDDLEIAVNFNREGVNIHGLQLLLLDRQGFTARVYHTVIWNNDQVIDDLRRLVAE